jgi:hypothetical protein
MVNAAVRRRWRTEKPFDRQSPTRTTKSNSDGWVLRHDRRQSVLVLLRRACEEIVKADWADL